MYRIKISTGEKLRIDQLRLAHGTEHNSPSVDCGDIEVLDENDCGYYLAGKDTIPWDRVDTIVNFINESICEPALDTEVPDAARLYVQKLDENGIPIRTQEEISQINAALDRLQDECKHVLINFDWSDFPTVDDSEFEIVVNHDHTEWL